MNLAAERTRTFLALWGTLVFHGGLALAMALILVEVSPQAPSFVEVDLGALPAGQLERWLQRQPVRAGLLTPAEGALAPERLLPEVEVPTTTVGAEEKLRTRLAPSLAGEKEAVVHATGARAVRRPSEILGARKATADEPPGRRRSATRHRLRDGNARRRSPGEVHRRG